MNIVRNCICLFKFKVKENLKANSIRDEAGIGTFSDRCKRCYAIKKTK